ncbi:MAG: amidophosphoribosyltransferase [Gammaproteobacteria bacterium]
MCGIVAVATHDPVQRDIYNALTVLQHRGQDAAGIAVLDGNQMRRHKGLGFVRDVFKQRHIDQLIGCLGIGHVRYPTEGSVGEEEAQPMYVNAPFGISLAHNGNLINTRELRTRLQQKYLRDISTDSDSEILLNMLAYYLQRAVGDARLSGREAVFEAVRQVMHQCQGAYSVVAIIKDVGLVAFRDPRGVRPLCIGRRCDRDGRVSYMVASESAALGALDYELMRDIQPGEAVILSIEDSQASEPEFRMLLPLESLPCIFEWVYLARPDSVLDRASVYTARLQMGRLLANQVRTAIPDYRTRIDAVIPIPECSTTSAGQMASELQIPYREAFVKNRYIGRTFIMPLQSQRRSSVRQKLNPLPDEFRNKSVLLVDDSIVRGTTCCELIAQARAMGAKQVFFASAAPPVRHANVFGIDMPNKEELIAYGRNTEQIRTHIDADQLIYQKLEDLEQAVRYANPDLKQFETSIFTGQYHLSEINADYLEYLASRRSDEARQRTMHFDY